MALPTNHLKHLREGLENAYKGLLGSQGPNPIEGIRCHLIFSEYRQLGGKEEGHFPFGFRHKLRTGLVNITYHAFNSNSFANLFLF